MASHKRLNENERQLSPMKYLRAEIYMIYGRYGGTATIVKYIYTVTGRYIMCLCSSTGANFTNFLRKNAKK